MSKTILFLFMFVGTLLSAQNYTEQQVDKTTDPKVVANFIKNNPNHPKTPEYKRKLYAMINGGSSTVAKPKIETINKKEMATAVKKDVRKSGTVSKGNQKTAELLTHLFNNDPNKREAYIHIKNKSKCNLLVKVSGKKFYNLTVPARNDNYILVNKGSYTITTSICDAQYSAVKNVQKDMEITLDVK
ncbi:MAG: hypothetical protein Q4G16_09325 [Cruoricaptor ignavus]|nr:hypothetical protein [Cruoricaptor ignavus]